MPFVLCSSRRSVRGLHAARRVIASASTFAALTSCTPAARTLPGTLASSSALPSSELPPQPRQMRFTWKYSDDSFAAKGEGVVRVGPPNRARLDFFLENGMAGGMAILDGDSLIIPGIELVRRFLPPVPLLWGTLGRVRIPAARDTLVRVDGDTLRADVGVLRGSDAANSSGRAWRLAFAGTHLARVERIEDAHVAEWITRTVNANGTGELRYVNEGARRNLSITITDNQVTQGFDDAIWRRP